MLIKLIHKLFPEIPLPKYVPDAKLRVQQLDNVTVALQMIEQAGVSVAFLKVTSKYCNFRNFLLFRLLISMIRHCRLQ